MELSDVKWNDDKCNLSGTALRTPGSKGKIFISVPDGYRAKHMDGDGDGVVLLGLCNGIATLEFRFERNAIPWTLGFTRS